MRFGPSGQSGDSRLERRCRCPRSGRHRRHAGMGLPRSSGRRPRRPLRSWATLVGGRALSQSDRRARRTCVGSVTGSPTRRSETLSGRRVWRRPGTRTRPGPQTSRSSASVGGTASRGSPGLQGEHAVSAKHYSPDLGASMSKKQRPSPRKTSDGRSSGTSDPGKTR